MSTYKSPRTGTPLADKILDEMRAKMPPEEVLALDAALVNFAASVATGDPTEVAAALAKARQDTTRSRVAVAAHDTAAGIIDRVRKPS